MKEDKNARSQVRSTKTPQRRLNWLNNLPANPLPRAGAAATKVGKNSIFSINYIENLSISEVRLVWQNVNVFQEIRSTFSAESTHKVLQRQCAE